MEHGPPYSSSRAASKAVDGDNTTWSHTECGWNMDIWYRMKFNEARCFTEVIVLNSKLDPDVSRMEDTEVYVLDRTKGVEYLCGVIKTTQVYTVAGRTYRYS